MIKKGHQCGVQRWFCKDCNRHFSSRVRIAKSSIIDAYLSGKSTVTELAALYRLSTRTIWRYLQTNLPDEIQSLSPCPIVAMMDTTYWRWTLGVVVIKDWLSGRIVWYKFINRKEVVEDYVEGIRALEQQGFCIRGIVVDLLAGITKELGQYPIQYCQFHQIQAMRVKYGLNPQEPMIQELVKIIYTLPRTDKESFIQELSGWREKWNDVLKEKALNKRGNMGYIHKHTRRIYHDLVKNTPYLWTFYDYPELQLPNTNNAMESVFTTIKEKVRLHRGMSLERKKKLIVQLLRAHNPKRDNILHTF